MSAPSTALDRLRQRQPEWAPWLAVVEEVMREAATSRWDAWVPPTVTLRAAGAPLLSRTQCGVDGGSVRRLLDRVIRMAARAGTPQMATLATLSDAQFDALMLFTASLCHDADRIRDVADSCGADAEALHSVLALLPVPFLHGCNRTLSPSIPESWGEGYCPVCGSWPSFAEVRGIERSRHFRCGRCGSEWHAHSLCCPYCGTRDHNELVALVPEQATANAVVEACKQCLGYVKTFTTLQGCPPGAVMTEDLASVALDVAAIDHGYARPTGAGYPIEVLVTDVGAKRRFFAWNA
jgi:FdhE protein